MATSESKEHRFLWTGTRAAKKHQRVKAKKPETVNHAVIRLRGKGGTEFAGEPILIGCVCGAWFWRRKEAVALESLVGDWAAPFRQETGVRARSFWKKNRGRK